MSKEKYTGTINIGLQKGYSNEYFTKKDYIQCIQEWQKQTSTEHQLMFSPAVFEFDFVCGELIEPHLSIRFINYPKSLVKKKNFRKSVNTLAELLMDQFSQNRILIEYSDRNILMEKTQDYDPKNGKETQ